MPTQCTQEFLEFHPLEQREVRGGFDGGVITSDAGGLLLREVEKRTGIPGAFIESDLVDPRYFSAANIKNRLESYFQMIDARRAGKTP